MYLVYPPKFCITIVFDLPWDDCNTQEKGIGFGFGFGFTTPFGWLVYLLWFWFYDSQVKTALNSKGLYQS